MEKAFVYVRNSTPDQALKMTEENQINSIKSFLINRPIRIIETFSDLGISGSDPSRDGLNKMIKRLSEVESIIVYDLDRLVRDVIIGLDLMKSLLAHGIKIYESRSQSYRDLAKDSDQLIYFISIWSASQERKKILMRQKLGIQRYKDNHNGKWGKSEIWGYDMNGDPITKERFIQEYTRMKKLAYPHTIIFRTLRICRDTFYKRLNQVKCEGIIQ